MLTILFWVEAPPLILYLGLVALLMVLARLLGKRAGEEVTLLCALVVHVLRQ